jgi:hypothetical protein
MDVSKRRHTMGDSADRVIRFVVLPGERLVGGRDVLSGQQYSPGNRDPGGGVDRVYPDCAGSGEHGPG